MVEKKSSDSNKYMVVCYQISEYPEMSGRIIFKKVEFIPGRNASHFPKTKRVSLCETGDTL